MSLETFDHLFARGAHAILAGTHYRDEPPLDGGERWGASVCLRPDDLFRAELTG